MGKPFFVMTAKAPVRNLEIYDCRLASLRIGRYNLTVPRPNRFLTVVQKPVDILQGLTGEGCI